MPLDAGTAYVKVKPDFSGLNAEVARQINPMAKDFGGRFGKALGPVMEQQSKHLRTFTTAAKYATVGAAGLAAYGFKDVVEAGAQFEKQMSTNAAVSEANRKQMALLEKQSIRLGKATFFSANEAAEAQAELIKGGLSLKQVLGGGLAAALSLAEAGELDLATAAETTVNAMKLFGLSGKDAYSVADMLSTAANRTTADVLDFAMALKQGGSVTKLAGYDMNETVTILEALAEAGIKNADAGTSMKAATIQLLKPSTKQAELAKELNLEWVAQNGHLKSGAEISAELRRATDGMTKAERAKTLATLAGTDGVRTLNALYAEGPKKLQALEKANAKQGTAQEIANKKMDNFAGLWEQFKGSLETTEIQIYKGMAPALEDLAEEATHAANEVGAVFEDPRLSGSQKIEGAFDVLSKELGGIWDRNEVTEHLVDVMDRAIPVVAEHAGTLGFEAAKGFGKGFLHADPLGKAVMGAWLLNFIGGKAAFVGTGRFFGLSLGKEIATTASATVATEIAATSVLPTAAAASAGAAGRWAPGAAWLGSGPAKKAAAASTSRALLTDAFGGFTLASASGATAQQVAKTGALKNFATKLGSSSAGQFAGGFAGSVAGALKAVQWGRIGAIGLGLTLADNVLSEFERRSRENSGDLLTELHAQIEGTKLGVGPLSINLHKSDGSFFDPFGVLGDNAEEKKLKNVNAQYEEMLSKRVRLSQATLKGLSAQAREIHLTKESRTQLDQMFRVARAGRKLGVAVDLRMDPKKLRNISSDFHFLRAGVGTTAADIKRVSRRAGQDIAATFGKGTKEARELTAQNMRAAAHAFEVQMDRSGKETKQGMARVHKLIENADLIDPSRKQAQAFGREWAKGLQGSKEDTRKGIQAMIAEAQKMPGPMRQVAVEAAFDQAKALKQGGDLSANAVKSARSRVLSEWSQLKTGGKAQSKGFADGVIGNVSRMVNTTGSALEIFQENVGAALKTYGVKVQQFELKTVGSGSAEQRKQMGGFIVPGSGDGDKFRTALPPGSFIENREAVKALPFATGGMMPVALEPGERVYLPAAVKAIGQQTLEARNSAVPRFQKGGAFGGVHEPRIVGPDPLRALGQSAIHKVFEGGQDYLRKHIGPRPGLGDFDGKPVSAWIIPILEWARKHGWDGSVTSGFRDAAEQIAAATGYGLQHYGPAGPLGSNHVKVDYPGGAVDVTLAAQLAAILKGYPGKPNLVWGGPVMGDFVHFSATGHQRGGLVEQIQKLATGGWVHGSSKLSADQLASLAHFVGMKGPGLMSQIAQAESGGDPTVTNSIGARGLWQIIPKTASDFGLDYGSLTDPLANAKGAAKVLASQGLGAWEAFTNGSYADFAKGSVSPLDAGSGVKSDEHSFKEDVPAVYHGCRTGSIDFPSVPKSLSGIDRELKRWEGEIGRYRAAVKRAQKEKKPGVAQALEHNVPAISSQLNKLRVARHKARFEKAKKALTKRLGKKLGKFARYETGIEGLQRDYNIASQYAEQVVGLEPTQSELPASASDAQREAAEKDFVVRFADYVNNRERPAYEAVLGKAGTWRNAILQVEDVVHEQEWAWEGGIRRTDTEIDRINEFTRKVAERLADYRKDHPKADLPKGLTAQIRQRDDLRDKLPWLRVEDQELRKALGEARGEFFGGGKNLIKPPPLPLEGSGALEEHLAEVQGIHWPDQHDLIASLPGKRVAGMSGGAIWETQTAIEELDLKIDQAASGLGGGGMGSGDKDNSDQEELTRQANQRTAVSEAQRVALIGWDLMRQGFLDKLPKAHTGGKITGASINPHREVPVMAQIGESVLTAEETGRLEKAMDGGPGGVTIESIVVHEDGRATVRYEGREFEAAVERVTRKSRGTGVLTPGGARR